MWLPSDRNLALAWMAEESDKCPGCSQRLSESTDIEAFEDYEVTRMVCHACAERDRHRNQMQRSDAAQPEGLFLIVDKRADLR